jgi:aminotransferase
MPEMAERTITISGLSKTYSVTGWRLAYTIACERLTSAVRTVHDFLTVGAPHPLQEAGATALRLSPSFYTELAATYQRKGTMMGFRDDFEAADFMLDEVGIAAVPGSSFYHCRELGRHILRFTFSKSETTLAAAAERLKLLNRKLTLHRSR